MSGKCEKANCAGTLSGFVEDQCPGDGNELFHCVNCACLTWAAKGAHCDECGDWYCIMYQHFFVTEQCQALVEGSEDYGEHYICVFCALENHQCDHEECLTYGPELAKLAKKARDHAVKTLCRDFDKKIQTDQ